MKNKINGPKFSGKHTTAIDPALPVIKAASKLEGVNKISLGKIVKVTGKQGGSIRVKFTPASGCLQAKICGHGTAQTIYIYSKDLKHTQQTLEHEFN